MIKKIVLWMLVLMMFSSLAFAVTNDAYIYYSNDNAYLDGTTIIDVSGTPQFNATNNGGTTGLNGILKEAISLDGINDRIEMGVIDFNNAPTLSFGGWFKNFSTINNNNDVLMGIWDNAPVGSYVWGMRLNNNPGAVVCAVYTANGYVAHNSGYQPNQNDWYHLACVYDGTNVKFYVNGTYHSQTAQSGAIITVTEPAFIGYGDLGGLYIGFTADEVFIYNRSLGTLEIQSLMTTNPYDVPALDTINLSSTKPIANSIFNTNIINLNGTGNFSYPSITNCSLLLNGTVNQTINGFSSGSSVPINFNVTFPLAETHDYLYYFSCIDNTTLENSTSIMFSIDQVNPTLITTFVNNSFLFNRNYTSWFNMSDELALNSVNISIDGLTYIYNDTMTGTFYNKQLTINSFNLTSGQHNLTVTIADGHTASVIPDYIVYQPILDDWIKYEFRDKPGKYLKIKGLPDSIFDKFTTEKKNDRYEFDYQPWDKDKTEYSFEIEASDYIKIVNRPDTKYGQWIIMDDKWMDFYTEENPNDVVEITRISDKKVSVKVSNVVLNDGKIKFKSIGDLNIITQNFTFFTTNYTISYIDPVLVLESQTNTFNVIDFTGLSSTATLLWNNTKQTVIKTTPSGFETHTSTFSTPDLNQNDNITVTWNYTLTHGSNTETGNISFTQEVLNIGIDDCTTFTNLAINYTIRNETDNDPINGSSAAAFKIWLNDSANYKSFNLSWDNKQSFGVCINPSSVNVSYYNQMEYTAAGQTKTYYINNANLDNVTDNINLYITDGTTLVTFTVIDENDNPVPNAFINVLSYDLGTDSFKTTEIIQTDSNGKAVANIILNTQFYKFLITLNSNVVLSTSPTKITSTTQTFQILLGTDYLNTFTTFNNVACSMGFNNVTKGFTYTFVDSTNTAVSACLNIIRSTLNSDTVINSSCLSSAAGTINLAIGETTQDYTYYATGTIDIDGNKFICADRSVSFKDTFKKFGTEGIMGTFLLVVALIAIGLWSPIVAALLATIALIGSWFIGFFFLTPGILIVYVILAIVFMMRMNK